MAAVIKFSRLNFLNQTGGPLPPECLSGIPDG
jgi:hypothetical protein